MLQCGTATLLLICSTLVDIQFLNPSTHIPCICASFAIVQPFNSTCETSVMHEYEHIKQFLHTSVCFCILYAHCSKYSSAASDVYICCINCIKFHNFHFLLFIWKCSLRFHRLFFIYCCRSALPYCTGVGFTRNVVKMFECRGSNKRYTERM